MKITETSLPGVLVIEPRVFRDARGLFFEVHTQKTYAEAGIGPFVQDNFSRSVRNTVRGMHFQEPNGQGKLCTVLHGTIYDVVVDVRRGSPNFGKWIAVELSGESLKQLWIPDGHAHGFCCVSESAHLFYKCTRPYSPTDEQTILWNDPAIGIPWPLTGDEPLLSAKDKAAPVLAAAPRLPVFA